MSDNTPKSFLAWSKKNSDIAALPFILLAVIILMTIGTKGNFLSGGNLSALASQLPELGLLSLAMMVIIITGGINLSIISTANLVSVVMAMIMTRAVTDESSASTVFMVVVLAIAAGILLSILLGFINGYLISYVGLPAMLATLGTMLFYEGVTLVITKGFVISGMPEIFTDISYADVFGIPLPLIMLIVTGIIIGLILERKPFGKHLYMIGSSEKVTRFSSVDTRKEIIKAYILSSILCAIAGMVMLSRFNSANARSGSSLLLQTILIAVLGGTDPDGGFGRVIGVALSLLILQLITSGLNLLGITQFITLALWGALLIIVIAYRHFYGERLRS